MLSLTEIKSLVKLAIKKYARTQANFFYFKNKLDEREEAGDIEFFQSLLESMTTQDIPQDKIFSQPNYVDFYNTLIDSDKREEVRAFCLDNDELIKKITVSSVKNAIVQLVLDKVEDLNENF